MKASVSRGQLTCSSQLSFLKIISSSRGYRKKSGNVNYGKSMVCEPLHAGPVPRRWHVFSRKALMSGWQIAWARDSGQKKASRGCRGPSCMPGSAPSSLRQLGCPQRHCLLPGNHSQNALLPSSLDRMQFLLRSDNGIREAGHLGCKRLVQQVDKNVQNPV